MRVNMKKRDTQCLIYFFRLLRGNKLLEDFSCGIVSVEKNGTWKLVEKSGGKRENNWQL